MFSGGDDGILDIYVRLEKGNDPMEASHMTHVYFLELAIFVSYVIQDGFWGN